MNRTAAIATGVLALAPAAVCVARPFVSDAWFWILGTGVVGGGWIITIGFLIFALTSTAVPRGKRWLWAALLFFGNFIVLPFFWFWYIWRANAGSRDIGT